MIKQKKLQINIFPLVGLICSTILLSGCFTVNLYHDMDRLQYEPDGELQPVNTLFATAELEKTTVLRRICPSGVSRVEVQQTILNGAFHYLTLGMYSPQTIRVWCKRNFQSPSS